MYGTQHPPVVVRFAQKLNELTDGSRKTISELMDIARNYLPHAVDFVNLIENRISACPNESNCSRCLGSIFLLDALIKNVGNPYTVLFKTNIASTFSSAYAVVDQSMKSKVCGMLDTWSPLYGTELVADICYEVQGIKYSNTVPDISKNALELVRQSRSGGTHPTIDMRNFRNTPVPYNSLPPAYNGEYMPNMAPPNMYPISMNTDPRAYPPSYRGPAPSFSGYDTTQNLLNLLNTTTGSTITPPHAAKKSKPLTPPLSPPRISTPATPSVEKSKKVVSTSNVVSKIIQDLYDTSVNPCAFCGFRFKDKEKMDSHLDWHFRKNETKNRKKPSSRHWFLPIDEWKSYKGLEKVQSSSPSFFGEEEAQLEILTSKGESRVLKDDSQTICDICNEIFESEYDSDGEQWVYVGAVRNEQSRICHVDCANP